MFCELSGTTVDGESYPRGWSPRLFGHLTADRRGLTWKPWMPWRKPERVALEWRAVHKVDINAGYAQVDADGWEVLALSRFFRQRDFVATLEAAGFVAHRRASWPGRVIVLPPGQEPDWLP